MNMKFKPVDKIVADSFRDENRNLYFYVKGIIDAIDPIGLIDYNPDEYELEVCQILSKLPESNSVEEIHILLLEVFQNYFGDVFSNPQLFNENVAGLIYHMRNVSLPCNKKNESN